MDANPQTFTSHKAHRRHIDPLGFRETSLLEQKCNEMKFYSWPSLLIKRSLQKCTKGIHTGKMCPGSGRILTKFSTQGPHQKQSGEFALINIGQTTYKPMRCLGKAQIEIRQF